MSFVYMVSDMSSFETLQLFRFVVSLVNCWMLFRCCRQHFVKSFAVFGASRKRRVAGDYRKVLIDLLQGLLKTCQDFVKTYARMCKRSISSAQYHCSFIQFILFRLSARARGELLGIAKCFYMFCGRLRMLCAIYVGCFVYVLGMLGNVRAGYTPHSAAYLHTSQNPHNTPHRLL